MFFDPLYLLVMLPTLALSLWAQFKVKSTINKYSEIGTRSGMTGAEVARRILQQRGITDVRVEEVDGFLSDHYDSGNKVLRLSPSIYGGRTIAAAGVAAHEVGHAIQHAERYAPLMFRQAVAPVASFGSNVSIFLILGGSLLASASMTLLGVVAFSVAVFFTLLTLPVEFDASRRAKEVLANMGMVSGNEGAGVAACLNAAAMTYVAAAVAAVAQLLYFLFRLGIFGGREE
ncbi:MAG: zinc metallopeptidase [Myxococcales bacterium]|nr:zinc metallopeptidase [Myxococcales bacterium]